MRKLENLITKEVLARAKDYLVPHIFTENYYIILKKKLEGAKLSENENYYYNHFIKKKLEGMMELFEVSTMVNGRQFIKKERLSTATRLIKKYSRQHKNLKILISGSFLFSEKYKDIDIFVISKYNKEDYREGSVHINYLPVDAEKTLFFKSIDAISVANFKSDAEMDEKFQINDLLQLYEVVVLLMMQRDKYIQELRDLIIRLEYISNKVILNSMQLKIMTDKIIQAKKPIQMISQYLIAKIISSYQRKVLIGTLQRFIDKNSTPEKGQKLYENWKIYNQTYRGAIDIVT